MIINAERIAKDTQALRQMEADYLRAKEFIGSDAYDVARLKALERVESILLANAGRLSDTAPFVIGAIFEVMHSLRVPLDTIRTYEAAKNSLDRLRPHAVE